MPEFNYKAVDAKGKAVTGTTTATNIAALARALESQGLFLMEGKPVAASPTAAPAPAAGPVTERTRFARHLDHIPLKDLAVFTAQFTVMVRTALPVMEALTLLAKQSDPTLRGILAEVAQSVREGKPLSQAFARYPKAFDEVYVSLISAGEASGNLVQMLERLSSYLQFQINLKDKVRGALVYPTIVILTAVAVVSFLVVFVLPTFMEVFAQLDVELPLPTRVLVFVSEQVRRWWLLLLAATAFGWWYFTQWLSDPLHTRGLAELQLKTPVLGILVRNIVLTRVLRTLGALVASGVPILKSLKLAQASAGNVVFHDLLGRVYQNVSEGKGLSTALADSPYIPPTVVGIISTGERTGSLPEVIGKVADFFESETDGSIRDLFAVMEPIFVVGLGLIVAGIAISILLPMFELTQSFE